MESDSQSGSNSEKVASSPFPPTLWTLVGEASAGQSEKAEAAIRQLCEIYQEPIVHWLRVRGHGEEARDLANGFVEFLLEKNRLEKFTRRETKFRSFLLKCLNGFLRDEWRKRTAEKRGGGVPPASLDEVEVGRGEELAKILDRQIALAIHRRVMAQLATEYAENGKSRRFDELKPFVLSSDGTTSYAEVGERLGMTANNVKIAVLRLRARYFELFREEVSQTSTREEVDAEMRYLITLLEDTEATLGQ